MDAPTIREKLIIKILNDLSDKQVNELLRYTETLQSFTLPDDYDEDNDPAVGFFSGPTDLSERASEILRNEFGLPRNYPDKDAE